MIKRQDWLALLLALSFMLIPLFAFLTLAPGLQKPIPIHWGLNGPNGFVTPARFPYILILLAVTTFLVWGIRFAYPLRKNVDEFRRAYNGFVVAFSFLLSLLLTASVQWAAGVPVSLNTLAHIFVGTILFVAGAVMYMSKRNWALGVRNPWTLSSDTVWNTINKEAGAYTAVVGALFTLLALLNVCSTTYLLGALLVGYSVFTLHSYLLWRREK